MPGNSEIMHYVILFGKPNLTHDDYEKDTQVILNLLTEYEFLYIQPVESTYM